MFCRYYIPAVLAQVSHLEMLSLAFHCKAWSSGSGNTLGWNILSRALQQNKITNNLFNKFGNFKEKRKLEILLFGIFPDNPDFYQTNKSLQIAVQQFLVSTNRLNNQ